MGDEFNAGFHHQHQHQLYKPSGAMSNSNSGSGGYEMISMGNYYNSPGGSMHLCANDGSAGGVQIFSPQSNSMGGMLLDSVPGLKHDTGLAVEWSADEQYRLEEGLAKYSNEPNMLQYIKIAASLQDKTVRDVALRCKWMMRKRRKQEEQSLGKKVKDRTDKLMESSLKNHVSSASTVNMPPYSVATNHHQSDYMLSGVLGSTARQILEENNQAFDQITANLSTLKWQENINLFSRAKNNLCTVLNGMSNTPGILSRMPPLPVLVNEELASRIFPQSSQPPMFGPSSSIPLKQEPGC